MLCYDADEAGQKAADRAGEILREANIKTRVLTITDGKDPDEYINTKGKEMFGLLVDNAESFIEYKIGKIEQQYNLEDTVEKILRIISGERMKRVRQQDGLQKFVNELIEEAKAKK